MLLLIVKWIIEYTDEGLAGELLITIAPCLKKVYNPCGRMSTNILKAKDFSD